MAASCSTSNTSGNNADCTSPSPTETIIIESGDKRVPGTSSVVVVEPATRSSCQGETEDSGGAESSAGDEDNEEEGEGWGEEEEEGSVGEDDQVEDCALLAAATITPVKGTACSVSPVPATNEASVSRTWRKRKLEVQNGFPSKKLFPEDKTVALSLKKKTHEGCIPLEKVKVQRSVIPSKDNPPPEMNDWLYQFQRWSNAERLLAIDQLIDTCEPTQVRHMMQVIEPQFQRDFISLLPKELALYVLSFLDPRDLLRAAQTCRSWRFLAEDNLLWREKCREAGIEEVRETVARKRQRGSASTVTSPWKCLRTLVGHTGGVWSSQMSGSIIISGSTDRTLKVWNAESGQCIHTLYGHTSTVRCMHLHGKKVVSGSRDATLRVWNIESGECLHVLVGHLAAVRCVQYDGRLVVSGAYDYMVKVWNAEREECLHTLQGHTNRVYSLQFDGLHVVSGSLDTSIRVWEVETGACRHTLMGHQSLTSGMELRNNILVSGNADSTVKVWDIVTGQCLQTLSGPNKHQSAVTCLQFNSRFVITSSDDGTVKLWDVQTGEFIRNLVALDSGGSGGVVWRIRANETKLVCAVGSRNGTEETKLLVLDFDVESK
uniref:(California timema) hypothetical protein n=1 Tax=Timema californicum TaxID=61474 RepID=A0A7R9J2B6_TIMCA|nr:unnamed protein product [Timema californicum]